MTSEQRTAEGAGDLERVRTRIDNEWKLGPEDARDLRAALDAARVEAQRWELEAASHENVKESLRAALADAQRELERVELSYATAYMEGRREGERRLDLAMRAIREAVFRLARGDAREPILGLLDNSLRDLAAGGQASSAGEATEQK